MLDYLSVFNVCKLSLAHRPIVHIFTDACRVGGGMLSPFGWHYIRFSTDTYIALPEIRNLYSALLGKFQNEVNAIIKKMGTPAKYKILAGDFNFNLVKINQGTMVPNFFRKLI